MAGLSRRLIYIQENERQHLARELHDEIGQVLTAIKINLQFLRDSQNTPSHKARLEQTLEMVGTTLEQVRSLSLDLRPAMLDDLGLVQTLRWYVNRHVRPSGVQIRLITGPLEEGKLSPNIISTSFRVAQEALTNIMRHSGAGRAAVTIRQRNGDLLLTVRDNGVGFNVDSMSEKGQSGNSLGLVGMLERARLVGGEISIESAPGKGTIVRARFPLKPSGDEYMEALN